MCGIVGVGNYGSQAIVLKDKEIFYQLLVANSVRGVHGTGVMKIGVNGACEARKAAGNPFDLLRSKDFMKELWDPITSQWNRFLVGHNRYATFGKISGENAHPFKVKNITLVHNGSLNTHFSKIPELKKYEVDSAAICAAIAANGLKHTLDNIDGAYTLVYFDSTAKTLNMIRNIERPLFLGVDTLSKRVMFASERGMLEWIAHRNDITGVTFKALPVGHLYTWHLDEKEGQFPEVTELIFKKTYGTGGYQSEDWEYVNGVYTKKFKPETKGSVSTIEPPAGYKNRPAGEAWISGVGKPIDITSKENGGQSNRPLAPVKLPIGGSVKELTEKSGEVNRPSPPLTMGMVRNLRDMVGAALRREVEESPQSFKEERQPSEPLYKPTEITVGEAGKKPDTYKPVEALYKHIRGKRIAWYLNDYNPIGDKKLDTWEVVGTIEGVDEELLQVRTKVKNSDDLGRLIGADVLMGTLRTILANQDSTKQSVFFVTDIEPVYYPANAGLDPAVKDQPQTPPTQQ